MTEPLHELNVLGDLVDRAAELRNSGTYSQRNPDLGWMVRCPHCRARRRQNAAQPCCSTKYISAVTTESSSQYKGKRRNPRLSRHSPPLFLMHQILVEMEAKPGHQDYEGLSGVVEAEIKRERKAEAKILRDQQKQSRKQNRKC